ncbi:hypothetical protein [Hymenobacter sp. UYCo722]|uniref:hypothetical protein n=1 Tax=Hymenobacter sp. UYCo722 TaxID=3156335 RepID=UPI00339AFCE9
MIPASGAESQNPMSKTIKQTGNSGVATERVPDTSGAAQRPPGRRAGGQRFWLALATVLLRLALPAAAQSGSEQTSEEVFIKAEPSSRQVYIGQALTMRYLLYYRVPLVDPDEENSLSFPNCFVEEYPPSSQEQKKTIDGQRYRVKLLKQFLIIPELTGLQPLPVLKRRYRFMAAPSAEDFFGQPSMTSRDVQSAALSLQVEPLPASRDSVAFCRAIGQFRVKASYEVSPKADNMLTVRIKWAGPGNLRKLRLAPPVLPAGVDLFNSHRREEHRLVASGMMAEGEYSYNVVTQYQGHYRLPGVRLSYFNPAQGRYVVFKDSAFAWAVTQGLPVPRLGQPNSSTAQRDNTLSYKHSLYQDNRLRLFTSSPAFYALLLASGALLLAMLGHQLLLQYRAATIGQHRHRKAHKWALRDLKRLERNTQAGVEPGLYYRSLYLILVDYYCRRHGSTRQEYASSNPVLHLSRLGPAPLRDRLSAFLGKLNCLRFSANPPATADRRYGTDLLHLIDEIEFYPHA